MDIVVLFTNSPPDMHRSILSRSSKFFSLARCGKACIYGQPDVLDDDRGYTKGEKVRCCFAFNTVVWHEDIMLFAPIIEPQEFLLRDIIFMPHNLCRIQQQYFQEQVSKGTIRPKPPTPQPEHKPLLDSVGVPEFVDTTRQDPIQAMNSSISRSMWTSNPGYLERNGAQLASTFKKDFVYDQDEASVVVVRGRMQFYIVPDSSKGKCVWHVPNAMSAAAWWELRGWFKANAIIITVFRQRKEEKQCLADRIYRESLHSLHKFKTHYATDNCFLVLSVNVICFQSNFLHTCMLGGHGHFIMTHFKPGLFSATF
eukprot:scaffold280646_cov18-Tisochrysis_lutea.AAC.1